MFPTVLKPKLLSFKNRWSGDGVRTKNQISRDLVLAVLSIGLMIGIYDGGMRSLEKIQAGISFAYFHPALPLGLILLTLSVMLIFSNSVSALGTFFLSHDLDLMLSSPLSTARMFYGKFIEVLISSSWMAVVFVLPALLAFGESYNQPLTYYLYCALILLPYFAIPSAISITAVTLFSRLIPASRTRTVLFAICILVFLALFLLIQMVAPRGTSFQNINDILRIVTILSVPNTTWSPSYWAATSIGEILEPTARSMWPYILALYALAIFSTCVAYITVRLMHFDVYSMARSQVQGFQLQSRRSQERLRFLFPFLSQQYRAIMAKEFKIFARDMSQALQLLLLLGLCMIYLYNFRILRAVHGLPEETQLWWEGFLVVSNVAMGAFVITAVGTRFVFPSISLEGQAYWILQTSPLTVRDILRAKFWCWLVPIATISSVILGSGALAIDAQPQIVIINALSSWIISYGIVGLGIGLGAFFANFQWEHSSQLAASFGSLLYMLFSTLLIAVNMVPTTFLVFFRTLRLSGRDFSTWEWYGIIATFALILMYINYYATRWALNMGENALEQRMER